MLLSLNGMATTKLFHDCASVIVNNYYIVMFEAMKIKHIFVHQQILFYPMCKSFAFVVRGKDQFLDCLLNYRESSCIPLKRKGLEHLSWQISCQLHNTMISELLLPYFWVADGDASPVAPSPSHALPNPPTPSPPQVDHLRARCHHFTRKSGNFLHTLGYYLTIEFLI